MRWARRQGIGFYHYRKRGGLDGQVLCGTVSLAHNWFMPGVVDSYEPGNDASICTICIRELVGGSWALPDVLQEWVDNPDSTRPTS